jgi:hypothetical protein
MKAVNAESSLTRKAPHRVPEISENIQEYLLCILFHFAVPFFPLLVELIVLGHVEHKSLFLFIAVYPLAIGVSSRNRVQFGFTVVMGIVFSSVFGLESGNISITPLCSVGGYICLLVILLRSGAL